MPAKQDDDSWLHCTLCRSGRQGVSTLNKALLRNVEWPAQGNTSLHSMEEPKVHTSIEDAFDTVLQYMNVTSRQCKRYFNCRMKEERSSQDDHHCNRFHQPEYNLVPRGHPLQRMEDVQVEVAPGSYAVSAGRYGAPRQHTHIVRLEPGQTVDLGFSV
ncbi:A-kinase-interacting protein 1-like isoform X1 [Acropora palmata]|uniref:A-kinase-interacting protein 1-like isoform X1 n=1 Tax=Acropora palmata TaxID=6131 RepID=UPI003DA09C0A